MALFALPQFFIPQSDGTPYPLAKLYTYAQGTTTPLETYTDVGFVTPHPNPVVADANGIFPPIYLNPANGFYLRVIAKDQDDVAISGWDIDDIEIVQRTFDDVIVQDDLNVSGTTVLAGETSVTGPFLHIARAAPNIILEETDASTHEKVWDVYLNAKTLSIRTRTDALGSGKDILVVTRGTGTALSSIAIGNATDLPTITCNGVTLFANGSFTATLSDMTATTTGTVYYVRVGKMITLYVGVSNILGTSNDNSMVLTGIPSTMYPVNNSFTTLCHNVRDNSNTISCLATIGAGSITFSPLKTDTVANYVAAGSDSFTTSGSKGLLIGWSVTYPTNE
jgi:hypothetical protein